MILTTIIYLRLGSKLSVVRYSPRTDLYPEEEEVRVRDFVKLGARYISGRCIAERRFESKGLPFYSSDVPTIKRREDRGDAILLVG